MRLGKGHLVSVHLCYSEHDHLEGFAFLLESSVVIAQRGQQRAATLHSLEVLCTIGRSLLPNVSTGPHKTFCSGPEVVMGLVLQDQHSQGERDVMRWGL